ncbi:hypothetical protein C0J52_28494 [Blattella germanica]|nr:hypothetical protein C0J52_28494 [Blattella germanica]
MILLYLTFTSIQSEMKTGPNSSQNTSVQQPEDNRTDALTPMKSHNLSNSNIQLQNTTNICNNSELDYNISLNNISDIRASIKNNELELTKTNRTITKLFEDFESAANDLFEKGDVERGQMAVDLTKIYIANTTSFLESITEHNSIIHAYKCIVKSDNISEIQGKYDQILFLKNKYLIQEFYDLHDITFLYVDILDANKRVDEEIEKSNSNKNSDLTPLVLEARAALEFIQSYIDKVKAFKVFLGKNEIHKPFDTDLIYYLTDLDIWESEYLNRTLLLKSYEKYKSEETSNDILREKVQPIIQTILLVIGFIGNALLLTIFARHKEIRTAPSMMILNLALGDVFHLLINVPMYYWYTESTEWTLGDGLCIAFRFGRQLGIGVSVYSILMISLHRFLALTYMFKRNFFKMTLRTKIFLSIFTVWVIGSLIGVPHSIHAGVYNGHCYGGDKIRHSYYIPFITLFDFIFICVVPLSVIVISSLATAYQIKDSVRKMPGESMFMDKHIKKRIVSARVMIALTVFSALSYIPFYLFQLLESWTELGIDNFEYNVIRDVTYTLNFANCCFNPIAIYIFSHKFRKYFNKSLFCRRAKEDKFLRQTTSGTTSSIL